MDSMARVSSASAYGHHDMGHLGNLHVIGEHPLHEHGTSHDMRHQPDFLDMRPQITPETPNLRSPPRTPNHNIDVGHTNSAFDVADNGASHDFLAAVSEWME